MYAAGGPHMEPQIGWLTCTGSSGLFSPTIQWDPGHRMIQLPLGLPLLMLLVLTCWLVFYYTSPRRKRGQREGSGTG